MKPVLLPILGLLFSLTSCVSAAPSRVETPTVPFSQWIQPESDSVVRIRIIHSRRPVRIGGNGPWEYRSSRGGPAKTSTRAMSVRAMRDGILMNGKTIRGSMGVRPLTAAHVLSVNGKQYRGRFLIQSVKGYIDVIEYVDMDQYLYGVLPREVGANWPVEALKAQAVISRTFALANKSENVKNRFDMVNDVRSQVYGGLAAEAPATNQAVNDTHGQVLLGLDQRPIQAFFHSSCGGFTEKPSLVWSAANVDPDTFASASDAFCAEDPHSRWKVSLPGATIRARLRKAGIRVNEIKSIEILQTSISGRAVAFRVTTRTGKRDIQGNQFRLAVGPEALRSTRITDLQKSGKSFIFSGQGWGHGVGLCQWGAKGRAASGQSYDEILSAYYPGVVLHKP